MVGEGRVPDEAPSSPGGLHEIDKDVGDFAKKKGHFNTRKKFKVEFEVERRSLD